MDGRDGKGDVMMGAQARSYLPHRVRREDRSDGALVLTSGHAMGPVDPTVGTWLDRWAEARPNTVFLAERSGPGWRALSYAQTREAVRAIAAALLERGLGPDSPIVIISGNSVDHGLLMLAAEYIGVPVVPLAEQYALIPAAHAQLRHCAALVRPRMVFADDGARYGAALGLDVFDGVEKLVSVNPAPGMTLFGSLLRAHDPAGVDAAAAQVGPDTVAKYLMTSGSTAHPKGVITTHGMMCANQTMIADALTFLRERPPVILDWLPWNHVFGGSHNFNMMLANGGSLYIDDGKPVKGLVERTIENLRLQTGTMTFNVPLGFAMVRDALKADAGLRQRYFQDLDMIFYAGASLPQDVWADLAEMAREVRGDVPLMTSSWGMTETAPACLIVHEPTTRSGIIGVPMTGVEIKLIPEGDGRYDLRVRGPNITPGYFEDPAKTAELFDAEGFLISGDAVKFVDPARLDLGLVFDGRMSEDFKLISGTWVRAANLRLDLLPLLNGLASDIVICGADRAEIGLMIFPAPEAREMATETEGVLWSDALAHAIVARLAVRGAQGSAAHVARALVLSDLPSMGEGEITAKGNLNFRKVLIRRAALLDRLYDDTDRQVIRL
jgi:feruloyl-CoA synthase